MTKISITPTKWVNNGYTIGYHENSTYFISGAIPCETVNCELVYSSVSFKHLVVRDTLEKSKDRIQSDCPHYLICGGCNFRHISYQAELDIKKQLLSTELQVPLSLIEVSSSESDGYRNNVQIKIQNDSLGFFKPKTNDVVDIRKTGCKHLSEPMNQYISKYLVDKNKRRGAELKLRLVEDSVIDYSCLDTTYQIKNLTFKVPPNGFFQVNRFLVEEWLDIILKNVPSDTKYVLDLFSGVGFPSLFLAQKGIKVKGFELDKNSVQYAINNAKSNHILNASYEGKNLYAQILSEKVLQSDLYFLNPPRNGAGKVVVNQILKSGPKTIIYSSCNYTTMSRDFQALQRGGYHIKKLYLLDFFPRTAYFETVGVLEKNGLE